MKTLAWIKDHAWLLLVILGGVAALVLYGRAHVNLKAIIGRELEAINAGQEARLAVIDRGEAESLRLINAKYADRLARLNADQKLEAKALAQDPVARARWLARITDDL